VVLGWDYEYNFDELWEARKKNVPEGVTVTPKTIPPEIYDYLKKAKSEEDLEALHGKIRFHEKPYLKIKCAQGKRNAESKTTKITIALDRYCIFDMPVEKEDDREELRNLQAENFAVFVDYWAVDTDYDGHTFRSRWQAVRGNGKRAKTVPVEAEFELPMGNKHRIAVRVVDIFGNDASAEAEADLRWKK
jgi:adenine-specific DNA-methyltransferase